MTTPLHPPPAPPTTTSPTSSYASNLYQPTKTQHLHYLNQTITLAKLSPPKPSNFRVGCVIVSYPESQPQTSTSTDQRQQQQEQEGEIISTGYTLELEGNTHAEQNALTKLFSESSSSSHNNDNTSKAEEQGPKQHKNVYLYTSLEPCSLRLSGNKSCVNRIIDITSTTGSSTDPNPNPNPTLQISRIIFGAKEPSTFVQESKSCQLLDRAGLSWEYIPDLEDQILRVAMEGHRPTDDASIEEEEKKKAQEKTTTGVDGMSTLHARVDAMAANGGMTKKTDVGHEIEEERRRQQQEEVEPRNPKKRMMEVS